MLHLGIMYRASLKSVESIRNSQLENDVTLEKDQNYGMLFYSAYVETDRAHG